MSKLTKKEKVIKSSQEAEVRFATTVFERLRGLKAHKNYRGVLALIPCHDVHTFGMRGSIDIAFVARDGTVMSSLRDVPPSSRRRCAGAAMTLERFASKDEWMRKGDVLHIALSGSKMSVKTEERMWE